MTTNWREAQAGAQKEDYPSKTLTKFRQLEFRPKLKQKLNFRSYSFFARSMAVTARAVVKRNENCSRAATRCQGSRLFCCHPQHGVEVLESRAQH